MRGEPIKEVRVKVTAGAHREQLVLEEDGRIHIFVREPPQGGMANKRVLRVLSEHFSVPYTRVRLVRGVKSRAKVFSISM